MAQFAQSILEVGCSCLVLSGQCSPLESYRSALRCGFDICMFIYTQALLIKLCNSSIPRKDSEFSLSGLKRHTEELFPFV